MPFEKNVCMNPEARRRRGRRGVPRRRRRQAPPPTTSSSDDRRRQLPRASRSRASTLIKGGLRSRSWGSCCSSAACSCCSPRCSAGAWATSCSPSVLRLDDDPVLAVDLRLLLAGTRDARQPRPARHGARLGGRGAFGATSPCTRLFDATRRGPWRRPDQRPRHARCSRSAAPRPFLADQANEELGSRSSRARGADTEFTVENVRFATAEGDVSLAAARPTSPAAARSHAVPAHDSGSVTRYSWMFLIGSACCSRSICRSWTAPSASASRS